MGEAITAFGCVLSARVPIETGLARWSAFAQAMTPNRKWPRAAPVIFRRAKAFLLLVLEKQCRPTVWKSAGPAAKPIGYPTSLPAKPSPSRKGTAEPDQQGLWSV